MTLITTIAPLVDQEVIGLKLFNIVVSHQPGRDSYMEALRYLRAYLPDFRVQYTRQSIILGKVNDPYKAVEILRARLPPDSPILRVIPVDEVTPPFLEDVIDAVKRLYPSRIPTSAKFAVRVEGRLYRRGDGNEVSRLEAQRLIGDVVDRDVNLSKPDYLILVKVVRIQRDLAYAAIMIAPPSSVYSRSAAHR